VSERASDVDHDDTHKINNNAKKTHAECHDDSDKQIRVEKNKLTHQVTPPCPSLELSLSEVIRYVEVFANINVLEIFGLNGRDETLIIFS
jgi:hypothetical protein